MIKYLFLFIFFITLNYFPIYLYAQEKKDPSLAPPSKSETKPLSGEEIKPDVKPPSSDTTSSEKEEETSVSPQFQMKLRELEEKVSALKEKVFDSKTRLLLLREQILHNIIAEARFQLIHKNDMGNSFTLAQVSYFLDTNQIYFADNKDGVLDIKKEFEVKNQSITPGNHILQVEMIYRGNSAIFSYLSGYKWKITSSFTFYAAKGKLTRIKSVGFKKGGFTAKMEDAPSVKFDVTQMKLAKSTVEEEMKAVEETKEGGGKKE